MAELDAADAGVQESPVRQDSDRSVLLKSITSIDELIDENGVAIMKLSMRSELKQSERDEAKFPSDLVHCLMKSHYDDPSILLARFVYALKILGHRRYGYRAIRRIYSTISTNSSSLSLADIEFDIDDHVGVKRNEFLLNQYLATACRLISQKYSERFILYCAKKLGHNPEKYTTPCEVITKLLEAGELTLDNHVEFMEEAMIIADVPERVLQEYQDVCSESDRFRPRTRSTSHSSNRAHIINQPLRIAAIGQRATESPCSSASSRTQVRIQRSPATPEQTTVEAAPQILGSETNIEEVSTHEEQDTQVSVSYRYYVGLGVFACCMVLICCLIVALQVAYATEESKANTPALLLGRENSSIILTEVNHLLSASLAVTEDTRHIGDFNHDIEVYQLGYSCADIPSLQTTHSLSDVTNISSVNGTTFYALADSFVNFSICGKTNATAPGIERLELLIHKNSEHIITDFFHVGTGTNRQCKESSIPLKEPGYYTITFLPPTHEATYTLNVTYDLNEIDTTQLHGRAADNYTLHNDLDSHTFHLMFGAARSCFVAVVRDNPNTPKENVHIQLHFTHQTIGHIIGGVLISVSVVFIVIVVVVVSCVIRHKNNVPSSQSNVV